MPDIGGGVDVPREMKNIIVIGASGFLGKHVVRALRDKGCTVRCSARDLSRVQRLAEVGCETVRADISDIASLQGALDGIQAVYISIHTLSPQTANATGQGFMDVEMTGLHNIVTACKAQGVGRLIYITFLGTAPDAASEWIRGRWKAENFLLNSGLDVTVIRPGQIVGVGGLGFNTMVSLAKQAFSINMLGNGKQRMRNIAIDDVVYYLVGVLDDPRSYGKSFDVGCDDVLTYNQMLDVAAEVLGRRHPTRIDLPRAILGTLAPLVERAAKLPKGAIKAILDSVETDSVGDPEPIRAILPRRPVPYRQAVEHALTTSRATGV
jgi:uncharacterized protein YbjT (DUF2867 family)